MNDLRSRFLSKILKVFYKLLYYRMAWTYDLVAWTVSVGMWKDWVQTILPYLQGKRILELGHGPGHLQAELHRRRNNHALAAGLDRSPQMGQIASRRLKRLGFTPGLVNAEAQNLPFAGSSFDQVSATFPTDYIVDPMTLSEIRRILAPRGQLVILPGAYITGRRPLQRAAASLFRFTRQAPEFKEAALDPFKAAGFETEVFCIEQEASRLIILIGHKKE